MEPEWLVWLPGIVTGLNVACRAVDGDVITATPVYPPFLSAPVLSGSETGGSAAGARADNRWGWDFAAMEAALTLLASCCFSPAQAVVVSGVLKSWLTCRRSASAMILFAPTRYIAG